MPRLRPALTAFALAVTATLPQAQDAGPERPNYRQARQYSAQFLGQRLHSTSVDPQWIGETDRFWYRYQDSLGTRYVLIDPEAKSRAPLFDHARLAADLSVASKTPTEAAHIELVNAEVDDEGKTLTFVFGTHKFSLDLASGALTDEGEASEEERRPRRSSRFGRSGRGGPPGAGGGPRDARAHRNFAPDRTAYVFAQGQDLYYVEASDAVKKEIAAIEARLEAEEKAAEEQQGEEDDEEQQEESSAAPAQERQRGRGRRGADARRGEARGTGAQDGADDDEEQRRRVQVVDVRRLDEAAAAAEAAAEEAVDERERWADAVDEFKALRLSSDGEEDYGFAGFGGFFRRSELGSEGFEDAQGTDFDYDRYAYDLEYDDPWAPQDDEEQGDAEQEKSRPNVDWAPDSSAFYAVRRDSRGVQDLFLVNSIADPRPALETYPYPMPGEESIRRSELFVFDRAKKSFERLEPKWKDEGYSGLEWSEEGHELRLLRRDRLLRNIELCTVDPTTLEVRVLLEEGFLAATIAPKGVRVLEERKQFVWWSERSGWGHFYLYGLDGQLVNPITQGRWLASDVVEVDEEKGLLYFRGNGREPGENIYYEHLYRVNLDGTGLTLMDPGDAFHRSALSPNQRYLVDNSSRVDMAPVSVLRDAYGNDIMEGPLEQADMSRLYEVGWKMPETFTVKAADGVTDLYGNLWKPFDFDPTRKYPIIAEVYPGPQTEGVTHTFSASNARQQLAQIGFIVIQVGHRGGTPDRDKAYHSYGYFNLRDYGLEDKKAAIEELAKRHSFIDVERVGLYGHSGGGFMTAAAMMLPPYNEFFKVGVSSAGNHDNNIYNNSWSERYHGLREVAVERQGGGQGGGGRRGRGAPQDERRQEQRQQEQETRFEIHVPTNQELAENLKGNLLLVHGEIDNNVHPANTMRLVDALIKANKRFELLIIPGARHGFGAANEYFNQRKWEFFAEHLLGDHQAGADIQVKE